MVTAEMLKLLDTLGVNQPRPNGRTLAEHLEGTRALLARMGSTPDVCLAGLFHSIYGAEGGTARARDANLNRRDEVRGVIGPAAEELAYLYSALERRHLFGNARRDNDYTVNDLFENAEVPVPETTLRALFEIEAANFVEGSLSRFDAVSDEGLEHFHALWESARRFVRPTAYAAVMDRHAALAKRRRSRSENGPSPHRGPTR
jgi:hypothetical protein